MSAQIMVCCIPGWCHDRSLWLAFSSAQCHLYCQGRVGNRSWQRYGTVVCRVKIRSYNSLYVVLFILPSERQKEFLRDTLESLQSYAMLIVFNCYLHDQHDHSHKPHLTPSNIITESIGLANTTQSRGSTLVRLPSGSVMNVSLTPAVTPSGKVC